MNEIDMLVEASKSLFASVGNAGPSDLDELLEAQQHLWGHVNDHKSKVRPEWMTTDKDTLVEYYFNDITLRVLLEAIANGIDGIREKG